VDAATEGLIVKTLVDTYEPSKRSSHWLKVRARVRACACALVCGRVRVRMCVAA